MKALMLVSSLASLGVLSTAAYVENFRGDWRTAQTHYKGLLLGTAADDASRQSAESIELQHQQIYLPDLNVIDRCTTCHLGVENPAMTNAAEPLTLHPGVLLAHHPADKFGCTICHGGQGRAIGREEAHGWRADGAVVSHVDTPLLRGEAVYTSCGKCHAELDLYGGETDLFAGAATAGADKIKSEITEASLSQTLPGADRLADGKRLTASLGCLGCHKYRGRGGTLGPELTYVGDKTKHDFDFSRVSGEHTVEHWLFKHFKLPQEVSPNTVMPDMGLSDDQARDLALYMMSLHRKTAPASHTPRLPPDTEARRDDAMAVSGSRGHAVRGETLYNMFCSACHGSDGYGTTMRAGLWPTGADPWGRDWDVRTVVVERRSDIEVLVPSLHHPDTLASASDEYLRRIIRGGRPGTKMLAWGDVGGLTDDEITLLVDYIRGWEDPPPALNNVSANDGDPRVGAALYRANCSTCHGVDGQGAIGVSLNSPTFLAVASDAYLRDTIVNGRPNTAMPSWREFSSQELSDLLAFMREWQPARSDIVSTLSLCETPPSPAPPLAPTPPSPPFARGWAGAQAVSATIGRTLFNANCVMCHGDNGQGDLGPSLNTQAFLTAVPDSYLAETMIRGRPGTGMPSWRHLSNEDVASLVQFIRTWQNEPSKSDAWRAQNVSLGDWDAGRQLFIGQCAACHGRDGEGATGPQLNNPVFLGLASDAMLREWISNGKEGTEMRSFRKGGQGVAELSERQIEDLVAYLRLLQRAGEGELTRVAKSPHGRPERGERVYAAQCVGCHGPRGEGANGPALSNPNFLRFASDGFLMATMALGRSGTEMRPVKRGPQSILELSSDEVNDLVAYLRSWESAPPFQSGIVAGVPHRFVVPWDLARGKQLFASNCAGCHGVEGKGLWAPELNNEGFLSAATDGMLQATIIRGRTGTAMRSFGHGSNGLVDLMPQDVDDIVAYMRHWSKRTPSPMTIPAERSLERRDETNDVTERRTPQDAVGRQSKPTPSTSIAATGTRTQGDER